MKRVLSIVLAAVLLLALSPASLRAEAADKLPVEGEYTLFALEIRSRQLRPEDMGMSGRILLSRDGTGKLVTAGTELALSKWTEKDGILSMTDAEGTEYSAALADGILELDGGAGGYLYFAREGVKTEGFVTSGHPTASRLYAYYKALDAEKGVHLQYQFHSDYMDSTSVFEVHAKGERFYSQRTTKVKGYESPTTTLYTDGTVYLLDPSKKTATTVMSVSPGMLGGDILLLDDLCKVSSGRFMRTDYQKEERELDGVKYQVEFFPAEEYTEEAAFFFDEEGQLVHILVGAPQAAPSMGETFYTIQVPDDKVDEALFELKAYTVSK